MDVEEQDDRMSFGEAFEAYHQMLLETAPKIDLADDALMEREARRARDLDDGIIWPDDH